MPIHTLSRTKEKILFEQPISSILPSLSSDHAVWSISPEASVFEASERMTANNVGALVVLSAQKLDGIITQEDVHEVVLQGKDAQGTRVSEIMTRGVYYANPGMTIDTCMLLMASRRLRHLPVLDGTRVINMISIGDILERVTLVPQT
jgi:signal-transduction protein with cAMP-binding, CBS, and nucleotidyltransferase domain